MILKPIVSVVMANHNGAAYLADAIRSLQVQSLREWELLLADDGSADESLSIARSFAESDTRIEVVARDKTGGPAAARNTALARLKGKWMAVFDSDDIMASQRLEHLLKRAENDHAHIVADNLITFSGSLEAGRPLLNAKLTSPRWIDLATFIDSNRLYSRMPDLGLLKPMIRTDLLRESGIRYNENLRIGEDYDFMAQLLAYGSLIRFDPAPHYFYRKHANSISHRIRAAEIEALIAADLQFAQHPLTMREAKALDRRTRSLRAMLEYDTVVNAIKAGQFGRAARVSAGNPLVWPLLTRPIGARLRRLAAS